MRGRGVDRTGRHLRLRSSRRLFRVTGRKIIDCSTGARRRSPLFRRRRREKMCGQRDNGFWLFIRASARERLSKQQESNKYSFRLSESIKLGAWEEQARWRSRVLGRFPFHRASPFVICLTISFILRCAIRCGCARKKEKARARGRERKRIRRRNPCFRL